MNTANTVRIWTITNPTEERFLRQPVKAFDFNTIDKKSLRQLLTTMRAAMKQARGVGLSANQIGINAQVFVARVENKSYTIFNPIITKQSKEKKDLEEGCLSIPYVFGMVERPSRVTLDGFDQYNKPIKIKAWGLLARVFQHEVDHLNGVLFIDRTKDIYKIPTSERLQKRAEKINKEKDLK